MDPGQMSQEEREAHEVFELGDFLLQSSRTIRNAKLAFKVWGKLNRNQSNAILYPTWYSGPHWDHDWLIGRGMGLDPSKLPEIRVQDNVRAQHRLVTERFGIKKLVMVFGWSMGAGQTFQWGVSYPDMVERLLPFCARTSDHNKVFLDGLAATMKADADFKGGCPSIGRRSGANWGLQAWRTS
ncbi:hypothetical protein WJX77_012136 [Trebouxia sp. C0004]